MQKVDVSVIIPVHNNEKYIEDCLLSFLKQDTELNYELLVVLDSCTDRTEELVTKLYNKYKKIKIAKVNYLSPLLTRVEGINLAKGEFIMFMDSDDVADKNSINILYEAINSNKNIDLVTASNSFQKHFKIKKDIFAKETIYEDRYESISALFTDISFRGFLNTKIYKAKILKSLDFASLPQGNYMYEDLLINFLYLLQTKKAMSIKNSVWIYNKDNVKSITNCSNKRIDDNLLVRKFIKEYLKNLKDDELTKIFKKHYFRTYLNLLVDIKYSKFASHKDKQIIVHKAKATLRKLYKSNY